MTSSPICLARLAALATLPLLAGCLSLQVGCIPQSFKAKRTVKLERKHRAESGLQATTVNGALQVSADSKRKVVTIEATLIARGHTQKEADSRVAEAKVHAYRDQKGNLIVAAEFPKKDRSNDAASFKILLPGVNGAKLHTTNGAITASGLAGALDVRTVNGGVKISKHEGDAVVRTTNGSISLADHGGSVRVHTTNAAVVVDLKPDQKGPVQVKTTNGSVRLNVGAGFAGSITARTSNGRVHLKYPGAHIKSKSLKRNRGRIEFDSAGEESVLRSTNGGITVSVEQ